MLKPGEAGYEEEQAKIKADADAAGNGSVYSVEEAGQLISKDDKIKITKDETHPNFIDGDYTLQEIMSGKHLSKETPSPKPSEKPDDKAGDQPAAGDKDKGQAQPTEAQRELGKMVVNKIESVVSAYSANNVDIDPKAILDKVNAMIAEKKEVSTKTIDLIAKEIVKEQKEKAKAEAQKKVEDIANAPEALGGSREFAEERPGPAAVNPRDLLNPERVASHFAGKYQQPH